MRDDGRTLLVTTQVLADAERCDAVALITDGGVIALASPSEMRRMASGGDVIQIELAHPIDVRLLFNDPHVHNVTQNSPLSLRVTVDDAGVASPAVVDAIGLAGGEVRSVRESRPSFDEVFAVLVTRHREVETPSQAGNSIRSAPGAAA